MTYVNTVLWSNVIPNKKRRQLLTSLDNQHLFKNKHTQAKTLAV